MPSPTRKPKKLALAQINRFSAGVDIGARSHFIAVSPTLSDTPVREFGTFTRDLKDAAAWLKSLGIKTVAMESTGVYWIPFYDILEQEDLEVRLVHAQHIKYVPGRKSIRIGY